MSSCSSNKAKFNEMTSTHMALTCPDKNIVKAAAFFLDSNNPSKRFEFEGKANTENTFTGAFASLYQDNNFVMYALSYYGQSQMESKKSINSINFIFHSN